MASEKTTEPLTIEGISRIPNDDKVIGVHLSRVPTDKELLAIHDALWRIVNEG